MSPIDRSSDRPVSKQIADEIRASLEAETADDVALPEPDEVVGAQSVSRRTVPNAFKHLAAENYVRGELAEVDAAPSRARVRRVAAERFARSRREAGQAPFGVDMQHAGLDFDVEILELDTVPAPQGVSRRLGVGADAEVLVRSRRYVVDGAAIQVAASYFPLDVAEAASITGDDTGPGGVYARIEDAGFALTRFTEDVWVDVADSEMADLLDVAPSSPLLRVVRTAYAGRRAVEVCDSILDSASFELSYEIAPE